MNGLFIAYGPDVKNTGKQIETARIIDLAPTILHMFNLEIPEDMDGKPLIHMFRANSLIIKRPIKYRKITEKERIKESIRRLQRIHSLKYE